MSKAEEKIKALQAAADKRADDIRLAFLAVIEELRSNLFNTADVKTGLKENRIDLILTATQVDQMDDLLFGMGMQGDSFTTITQDIFVVGAMVALSSLSLSQQKAISFDAIGERAVNIMRNDSIKLAAGLTESTKAGVRAVIARTMAENTETSQMVKEIRQLIGLTEEQAQAVMNFRRQLEARKNLGFTPVDERRLTPIEQAMVRRHMADGFLSTKQIDDMVERYFQSMLNKRATDIALTEALNAVNNGQQELWEQSLDQGVFDDDKLRKHWFDMGDGRVRPTHKVIAGMNPGGVRIRSMFSTPHGMVMGPGTSNPGFVRCRCGVFISEIA
jgi:hypothetical protein